MSSFGGRFEPRDNIDCACDKGADSCTCEQDAQDAMEADRDDRNDAIRKGEW